MIKQFENDGTTFSAFYAAENWLKENGYSYGNLCGPQPVGIMKGSYNIAKWRNLTTKEIKTLDGVMMSGDWRNGVVTVEIYEK